MSSFFFNSNDFLLTLFKKMSENYDLTNIVFVLDNSPVHRQYNDVIQNTLAKVNTLFLPTYSPMLNPIELVWQTLKKKVK